MFVCFVCLLYLGREELSLGTVKFLD